MADTPAAVQRDVETLQDIAAKLTRLLDITNQSIHASEPNRREKLFRAFWNLVEQIKAINAATLSWWPHKGYPVALAELQPNATTVCAFTANVLTAAFADSFRTPFVSLEDGTLLPLRIRPARSTGSLIDERIARIFPARNKRAAETWGRLCSVVQQLLGNDRCREACEAVLNSQRDQRERMSGDVVPSAFVVGKTPDTGDGPLKPDGFRLNGIEVWGLVKDWQKVLTFVCGRRTDPPKWSDVTTHLGVQDHMTDGDFAKLIYKINQKVKGTWPETLQTVRGLVVLRKPIRGDDVLPRSTAKAPLAKKPSRNTTRESVSKAVGTPPSKRKSGVRKK